MKVHKLMLILDDGFLIELLEMLFDRLKMESDERESYLFEYKNYEGELIVKLLSVITFNQFNKKEKK